MPKNQTSKYQKPLYKSLWGKMKKLIPILIVVIALSFSTAVSAESINIPQKYKDLNFQKTTIGDKDVYFAQQEITDGKHTVKVLDSWVKIQIKEGKILKKEDSTKKISKDILNKITIEKKDVISQVQGEVQSAEYYILSKTSPVFENIKTDNPVIVVHSLNEQGNVDIIVFDATNGENLGKAVPPPYTSVNKSFVITGPSYAYPCQYGWTTWYDNAKDWFDQMEYNPEQVLWPEESQMETGIGSHTNVLFYEMGHGGSTSFASGCVDGNYYEYTSATEIETWMQDYEKIGFSFIGSCNGLCDTSDNTVSYELMKGETEDATAVGYCGMGGNPCTNCWYESYYFQDHMFGYMSQGYTVYDAFNQAMADHPTCQINDCIRFTGDQNYAIMPEVKNREYNCGDAITDDVTLYEGLTDCSEDALTVETNDIIIDCQDFTIDGINLNSGIKITGKTGITVKNCNFQEFENGILLEKSTDNKIHDNTFEKNAYGAYLMDSSDYNSIWNNRFLLSNSAYEIESNNNQWTVNKIGNFWYDFNSPAPRAAMDLKSGIYEIPGSGNGIDYAPKGILTNHK